MIFQQISHSIALNWIHNNLNLKNTIHENFYNWYEHLNFPNKLSYFKNGNHNWSAAIEGNILAIYYYSIYMNKMYDGFLVSSKPSIGLKLDKYQKLYTKSKYNWKINWTMCNTKHLNYNLRLGYKIASGPQEDYYYMYRK